MIKLGQKVKDSVTGFEGIVIVKCEYLTGCTRFGVQGKMSKDGKIEDAQYFDENRLDGTNLQKIERVKTGGSQSSPKGVSNPR